MLKIPMHGNGDGYSNVSEIIISILRNAHSTYKNELGVSRFHRKCGD